MINKIKTIIAGMSIIACSTGYLFSATITSVASGSFNVSATWGGAGVPTSTDDVVISATHTVTLTSNVTIANVEIQMGGVLDNNGFQLSLINISGGTVNYIVYGEHNITGNVVYTSAGGLFKMTGPASAGSGGLISGVGQLLLTNCVDTIMGFFNVPDADIVIGYANTFGCGSRTMFNYATISMINGDFSVSQYHTFLNYGNLLLTNGNINLNGSPSTGIYNFATGTITLINGDINLSGGAFCANYGNLTIGGSIYTNSISAFVRNFGTLNIAGSLCASPFPGRLYASGTVNYNGSGNQIITRPFISRYMNLTCSGSGVKTLVGNIIISGDLTIRDTAQLDVSKDAGINNYDITIAGNWYDSSIVPQPFISRDKKVIFNGDSTQTITATASGGETFYAITVSKTNVSHLVLNNPITISDNINLVSGIVDLNQKILTIINKADTAIIGGSDTAYIQSEDPTGNNQSRVQWNVKDSIGNYIIPFGVNKGGTNYYIPFSFNKTTNGIETSTGSGNISVSTYATPTSNIPYPQAPNLVTPVDNPANAVDRFWQVDVNGYNVNPTADLTFSYPNPEKPLPTDELIAQRWNPNTMLWDAPSALQSHIYSLPTIPGLVTTFSVTSFSSWTLVRKNDSLQCPPIALTSNTTICYGLPQTLSAATDPDNFYTLVWSPATGLSSITGDTTTATLGVGTITYTVSGTEAGGCYSNSTVSITVIALPTITGTQNLSLCYGVATLLSATGATNYSWSPATYLNSATGSNVVFSQATVGINSYTVTGYNELNCANTHTLAITVNASPTVNAGQDQTICKGNSVTLNAIGTGGGYFWYWSPSVGLYNYNGLSVNANPVATTTYTLTAGYINGCIAIDTVKVSVSKTITGTQNLSLCYGADAVLSATGATSYSWSPATYLNSATGSNVVFSQAPVGTQSYTVTAGYNEFGCANIHTLTVTVNALPTVNAGSDQLICLNDSVLLSATGSSGTYTWSPTTYFTTNTGTNVIADFPATAGSYTCSVFLLDNNNCSASDTVLVNIVSPLISANAGADISICSGSNATLSGSGGITFYWYPEIGLSDSIGAVVIATPTTTTVYKLITSNGLGCIATDSVKVTVNPLPMVDAGADQLICVGSITSLHAIGTGGDYTWFPTAYFTTNTGANVIANFPEAPGSYTCSVSLIDNNNCGVSADTLIVTIAGTSTPNAGADISICSGSNATLSGSGGITFYWYPEIGLSDSIGAVVIATPTTTTVYKLITSNGLGCIATDSVKVTVNPLPMVDAGADQLICVGSITSLHAIGTGGDYTWFPTAYFTTNTGANVMANFPAVHGSYTCSVSLIDINNCNANDDLLLIVVGSLTVNAGADISICNGSNTTLSASGGLAYNWNPEIILRDTLGAIVIASPTATTVYTLIASTGPGCIATDSIKVTVTNCHLVWPGDADNNLIANHYDLLPIGLHYGSTGPARSSFSNAWLGFNCDDWTGTQSNGQNLKYADCNGDGIINISDTLAIALNYGFTHNKNEDVLKTNATDPNLNFVSADTTFAPGADMVIELWAGDATTQVKDMYGLAFDISYNNSLIQSGSASITYTSGFMGTPGTEVLKVAKVDEANGKLYGAITRINHSNMDGYGKIAEIKFKTNTTATTLSNLQLQVSAYQANDSANTPLTFNTPVTNVYVDPSVGIKDIDFNQSVQLFPNPTNGNVTVTFHTTKAQAVMVKVNDMKGNEVYHELKNQVNGTYTTNIDLSQQVKGIYVVTIITNESIINRKVVVE